MDTASPSSEDRGGKVLDSASAISSEEASTSHTTPKPILLSINFRYVVWGFMVSTTDFEHESLIAFC
jgi:hypothetical protein